MTTIAVISEGDEKEHRIGLSPETVKKFFVLFLWPRIRKTINWSCVLSFCRTE